MPNAHAHRGVERVNRILDLVARAADPPTLIEITQALGLPRSTVADLLRELRAHGYLRVTDRRYQLGRRPEMLSFLAGGIPAPPVGHAHLEELSRVARAPLALAVLVGGEVLYLDYAGPRPPAHLRAVVERHLPRPALRTAAGRLLLTFADPADRAVILRATAETDPEAVTAFEQERPAIHRARVARSDGLADPGIRAVAVPVVEDREVVASIAVFGPRPRSPGTQAPTAELALDRAVAQVLTRL